MRRPVGWGWPRCSWRTSWERRCLRRQVRGKGERCWRWGWRKITSPTPAIRNLSDCFVRDRRAGRGCGVNALAGKFVRTSSRLLPRGGRFLEMGKTDLRNASAVSAQQPGVTYLAFDLLEAGAARLQVPPRELGALFQQGTLSPLPLSAYELRQAPSALQHMANGRHVGKLVLQPPRGLRPGGTVLITGDGRAGADGGAALGGAAWRAAFGADVAAGRGGGGGRRAGGVVAGPGGGDGERHGL